ncbi:MAG: DUF2007 domain-containing protein [Gammaproteobacteria bacterium]|nr:DUF2007 domain-containing protein [Gammaproteobacteria bacterium]
MKKLYACADRVMLYHVNNVMKSEGIDCVIKNDMIYSLAGEVPVNEVWPELWLIDETQQKKAETVLSALLASAKTTSAAWRCRQCGEEHGSQFTACWRCGFSHA